MPKIQTAPLPNKSPNLDLLRATAVSMVVATHLLEASGNVTDWAISLGHAGVMMFFVHTATVLMQSLERLEADSDRNLAFRFYVRRFFRIYPLPIFTVLVVVVVLRFYPHALNAFFGTYHPTRLQLLANLTLTQNLFGVQDIILVMWSLPPEVQMYAVLPIFFAFRKALPTSLLLFWAGWVIMLTFIMGTRAFDLLQYLPMFVPGILAYQYSKSVTPKLPGWLWPLAMAAPMAAFILFAHRSVVISWFACLILGLSIPHFNLIASRSMARAAAVIAKYSYGIYLAHSPCIFVSFYLFDGSVMIQILGSLAMTGCVAVVLFHAIERPMLNYGVRLSVRKLEHDAVLARGASVAV